MTRSFASRAGHNARPAPSRGSSTSGRGPGDRTTAATAAPATT